VTDLAIDDLVIEDLAIEDLVIDMSRLIESNRCTSSDSGRRLDEPKLLDRHELLDRREFLAMAAAAGVLASGDAFAAEAQKLPTRVIPATGEELPVIGLGSSKVVEQIATRGPEPLGQVLHALVAHGGRVVDTWPRNRDNDAAFGRVINEPDLKDRLFVTMKIDVSGKEAGIAQFDQAQKDYGRRTFDLAQIFSLVDVDVHWPTLRQRKEAGEARYIGVTVAQDRLYDALETFLARETPDFVQINYSISERRAEERLLPRLRDRGIPVIVNRPFMNGAYFDRFENRALPDWAVELGCRTWAHVSLKYILSNPAVTCVLTETTNPAHLEENMAAAFGPVPDAAQRARMVELIESV
jgi:diketogulonate reductase-like aldo/keto reductase